jgi:hypothetical protein
MQSSRPHIFSIRLIHLSLLSLLCIASSASVALGQNKIELQTCEDLKITKKQ